MSTDAEKLRNFRTIQLKITQKELADTLGLAPSSIGIIECGAQKIPQSMKYKILKVYNYDIDREMYKAEKEFTVNTSNIIPVPFYHAKAGANPNGEILMDYPETEALYFDKRWLKNILGVNPFNVSLIQAKGDSMDSGMNKFGDIKDGDLLLVDNSDTQLVNNKIFIIEISSDLLVKKVIIKFDNTVELHSNNPLYPPRVLTEADNARTIGKVVWNGELKY